MWVCVLYHIDCKKQVLLMLKLRVWHPLVDLSCKCAETLQSSSISETYSTQLT